MFETPNQMASPKINHKHYEIEFDKALENPVVYKLFAKQVAAELNSGMRLLPITRILENLAFLTAVKNVEKQTNAKKLALDCQSIYNTFIQSSAAQQVNLSGSIVKPITDAMQSSTYTRDMFQQAKGSILLTLKYSFAQFRRSAEFVAFLESCTDGMLRAMGTHMSDLQVIHYGLAEFSRLSVNDLDHQFAHMLLQDYYHWHVVHQSKDLIVCRSKKTFFSEEAKKQIGDMDASKMIIRLPMNALQAAKILCSNKQLPFEYVELLDYVQGGSNGSRHSAIVEYFVLPMMSNAMVVAVCCCLLVTTYL